MENIYLMENIIQKYAWGSKTAIYQLTGSKTGYGTEPWAELWMGAHPEASSKIRYNGGMISLFKLIQKEPEKILGSGTAEKYSNTLPFLFKILAASNPLSIQAHPDKIHAEKGFEKENKLKILLNAFNRNYKDRNHKPECICALTSFYALNGFRKISGIIKLMDKVCPVAFRTKLNHLQNNQDSTGLKTFFSALLTMGKNQKQEIISEAINKAEKLVELPDHDMAYEWMIKLHKHYPGDIGIFSPLILNLVCLEPGQAMFIPAGQLHSYLKGMGVELMANSDNVLRGGLTKKYIDLPELFEILNFSEKEPDILLPERINAYEKIYNTAAEEFTLSVITIKKNEVYTCNGNKTVEILLCTEGNAVISGFKGKNEISVLPGHSVFIPFCLQNYTIRGNSTIYKASVPYSDNSMRPI